MCQENWKKQKKNTIKIISRVTDIRQFHICGIAIKINFLIFSMRSFWDLEKWNFHFLFAIIWNTYLLNIIMMIKRCYSNNLKVYKDMRDFYLFFLWRVRHITYIIRRNMSFFDFDKSLKYDTECCFKKKNNFRIDDFYVWRIILCPRILFT